MSELQGMQEDLLGAPANLEASLLQDILKVQVLNRVREARDAHYTAVAALLTLQHHLHLSRPPRLPHGL